MAKVLVVDDTAVDRRLAGGLLEKAPDLQVIYATGGNGPGCRHNRGELDRRRRHGGSDRERITCRAGWKLSRSAASVRPRA